MVLNMKVNIKTARNMVMAALPSPIQALTQDSSKIMKSQVLVNTFGLMVKCMKASGKEIKCTEEEHSFGETARSTKDNSSTTSVKAMASLGGKTAEYTMVNGKMENSMELAFSRPKIIK